MLVAGIIISSLLLLGFTRFGIRAVRTDDGCFRVILRAGFVRIDLTKQFLKRQGKKIKEPEEPKKEKKPKEKKLTLKVLLRAVKPVLSSLRKGVRVDRIILRLNIAGGEDPCQAALLYGRLWAVWGMLRPILTENLRVRRERVEIGLDFDLSKTHWEGEIALTISLGRSLAVLLSAVGAIIKQPTPKKPRKAEQN
jgi:hypothetical protein